MGGILEEWVTFDIDMTIIGPFDTPKVRAGLNAMITAGFREHVFVDASFAPDPHQPGHEEPGVPFAVYQCTKHYVKNGVKSDLSHYIPERGLFRKRMYLPTQKMKRRIAKGYRYQPPRLLRSRKENG